MSLRTMCHAAICLTLICLATLRAEAHNTDKVGTTTKVSALDVYKTTALSHTTDNDTLPSFDKKRQRHTHQETDGEQVSDPEELIADPDSIQPLPVDTARLRHVADSLTAQPLAKPTTQAPKPRFVPKPLKSLWLALVLPGGGQIYNRKYWKLPIIYGGFLGCAYALTWNQMMYRDYSQAYLDIMDDDPNTTSYLDMLPPRYDISGREEQFKTAFKRKKDYYRRYRDLSAFCFVGVYLLAVIDAYVDAQLSEFDISSDLSMKVKPAVIDNPSLLGSRNGHNAYGVGCSLNF